MEHTVVIGDCRNMREIKNNSVHLVIASPPYFNIHNPSINYLTSFESYLSEMRDIFKECRRVLQKGRYICINMGDIVKDRDKILIPAHVIFSMLEAGFEYQEDIFWASAPKPSIPKHQTTLFFPPPAHPDANINDYERTMIFRKGTPKRIQTDSIDNWNSSICDAWAEPRDSNYSLGQIPESLIESLIRSYSREGETVLDPFLGNGITPRIAARMNRHSIGYEIDPYNLRIIRRNAGILESRLKVVFQGEGRLT